MRLTLEDFAPDVRRKIVSRILAALVHSPFARPSAWARAAVVDTPESRLEVVHRQALASRFREAGLLAEAHEAAVRKVRHGEVLLWLVLDDADLAFAGLLVVDLLAAEGDTARSST
jgi:hypothetical protein